MAFEEAAADRSMHWPSTKEADWGALYADHLPRIYNYFRFMSTLREVTWIGTLRRACWRTS